MIAYVGQTRARALNHQLIRAGVGEMTVRGEVPPRRYPWAYDNGAYRDWKGEKPFDSDTFRDELDVIKHMRHGPDFIVVPDIVGGGAESLRLSIQWVDEIAPHGPPYLAVQDGMSAEQVADACKHYFEGLFVGGTLPWKIKTGERWVQLAHSWGMPCHIGRVGTPNRVKWARRIGADSIDSSLPLFNQAQMQRFLEALQPEQMADLFPGQSEPPPRLRSRGTPKRLEHGQSKKQSELWPPSEPADS